MDPGAWLAICALVLGGAIGSFANVVIHRVPAGLSIVRPPSRCPACMTPIRLWHNLPVIGWLLVRGRCASCRVSISLRYPLIELLIGLLAVALLHDLAGGLVTAERLVRGDVVSEVVAPFVLYLTFLAALVTIAFIDLDTFLIPDVISLPLIPLGIATAAVAGHTVGVDWQDALVGAVVGGGVIVAIIIGYAALTGRQGMGGGDWKLLGAIGAWLGWQLLPMVLLAASLQGVIVTLVLQRRFAVESLPAAAGDESTADPEAPGPSASQGAAGESVPFGQLAVPFGPFLAMAAIEVLLFREELRDLLANMPSFGP